MAGIYFNIPTSVPAMPWTEDFAYGSSTGDPIDENYWSLEGDDFYPDYLTWNGRNFMLHKQAAGGGASTPRATSKLSVDGDFEIIVHFKNGSGATADVGGNFLVGLDADPDYFMRINTIDYLKQYYYNYKTGGSIVQEGWKDLGAGSFDEGRMRVTRTGGDWSYYYWTGSVWSKMGATHTIGTGPVFIELWAYHWAGNLAHEFWWDKVIINSGTLARR